jgi:PAS domain S-box-containing protein
MHQRQALNLLRLLFEIFASVALAEALVMLALPILAPGVGAMQGAFLDATMLSIVASPFILWRCRAAMRPVDSHQDRLHSKATLLAAVLAVWLVGLSLTAVGSWHIHAEANANTSSQFEVEADALESDIQERFVAILPALKGIRSTCMAQKRHLSRGSFQQWVEAREVSTDVPGVRGLGFIQRIQRADLADFIARERADGAPEFSVRSQGDAPDLLVIQHIEPIANNRKARGYDVGSEVTRRAAAQTAIDSGQPTLTARIALVQDGRSRPGLLYFLPIYWPGQARSTPAERRAALMGLSYAPIVLDELLSDLVKPFAAHVNVHMFDGQDTGPGQALFATGGTDQTPPDPLATAAHHKVVVLHIGQRQLTLDLQATADFESHHRSTTHLWFALVGAALSTLTAFTLWLVGMGRVRAEAMVETRTQDLAAAKAQAEHALRETQALSDALNQFNLVSVTDAHGVIQQVNDAFCKTSGYTREELMGQTHRVINSGLHSRAFWQEMWLTISAGRPWRGEICNRAKDGQIYWVHSMIAPHLDAAGHVEKYVSIRLDITQTKLLERDRQQISDRLEQAIDGGSDGLWDWSDVKSEHVWRSPQFYRLLGHAPATSPDTFGAYDAFLHPDDRAHALAETRQSLATGAPLDVEYRLLTKKGAYRWFRSRAKVYRDAHGQVCRMAGAIQDIHERRLAEFELADRVAQMKAIFSLTPDGFVAFDEAGQVSYVSPAFERLTGIPVAMAMESNEYWLFNVLVNQAFGDTAATCFAELPKALDMRPPAAGKLATAWHEGHGAVSKMLHLRDITQEAELDQIKSTFMSMAAHELRTPMASIYGFTELLLTREFKPAKQRELLQRIMRQSEGMIDIINELLDLSRLEAQLGRDFHPEDVNLLALVETVVSDYKVPEGRDAPRISSHERAVLSCVDMSAAKQTLLNVLSNAYKYSPGGGDVVIELAGASDTAAHVAVVIRDQGIGMTPEQLARVGERFYRADKSGNIPGTGLGMAIVTGTMTLMGGAVDIASELGRGTSVTLWFPAVTGPDTPASPAHTAGETSPTQLAS